MLRAQRQARGYSEPTLDELLADPSVRLVMARDGVEEAFVRRLVADLRRRMQERRPLKRR
jgi:hypothetical protein